MSINSNPTVDELVAAGRYADAARTAHDAGDAARAAQLYEKIWDFASAARCAREAGDAPAALRNAIDARDEALVREACDTLRERGDEGRRTALAVFASKRRFAEAAALAEECGDRERAVDLYLGAHRDLDAARVLSQLGRDREAGQLYERVLEQNASEEEISTAHLELGQLLARRLQHEPAVRHLQQAARRGVTAPAARRALVVELAALGLRDAARDVLLSARQDDPSLPGALDDYLRGMAIASAPAHTAPDLFAGRYRLDRLVGHGATGRVYRAVDEVTGREVAIKMVSGGYARGSQPYERFAREAGIASRLHHANLVEVFDFSADFGYLVMEFMIGGPLDRRIGSLGPGAVRRLVSDVLAGLEAAHGRGVIHRDIKPANIFFDARGTAKVGDFGVAHLLDLGQTQTGGLIGTLAYMSPEQITGAALTVAADLYSLGITVFECLTGRLPFLGPDFVAQHLGETPPLPTQVSEETPAGWDPIMRRLLAKDPTERYQTIDDLRRDLAALETGEGPAAPLLLPRAGGGAGGAARTSASRAAESSRSMPAVPAGGPDEPRYRFETPLGRTDVSTLSRAVDGALDRSVILERYEEGGLDEVTERRLYALAKSGGSFLQRVLAFDRVAAVVVYEAPAGMPLGEMPGEPALDPIRATRVLKRLARAVAPLHETGAAHGAIGPGTVVIDELDHPTVLASGLGRARPGVAPSEDVAALAAMVSRLAGGEPSLDGLIDRLAEPLGPDERAAVRPGSGGANGEDLYRLAEALEFAILRAVRGRGPPAGAPEEGGGGE